MGQSAETAEETLDFQAEVARLLHLMVHSVYSERDVFLRELISNASDACDKLRYEALTSPELIGDDTVFAIDIAADQAAGTLTVVDNGIGMDRQDLIDNLGTIARSGTSSFMDRLTGDAQQDLSLIGQFGVGFYSAFMVADRVVVTSRKAGDETAWQWESAGQGAYAVRPAERAGRGTEITLHLKDDARDFAKADRLETAVRTYSDHIAVPIRLKTAEAEDARAVNTGSALWTRPKADITDEQYTEFYRHAGHAFDAPAFRIHVKAEGILEYTVLLFVPSQRPVDLFDPARKPRVRLYVKRVFITDDTEELLPGWLRFLRGIVDSQDLPLNISREMLQNNPVVARIRRAVTNKVLAELDKLAEKDAETYQAIWDNFGPVLKEGIYEDEGRRDQLVKLARFRSTHGDGWTSLADYVGRMKDTQAAVYYVTGADARAVARTPQLEGFRAKGVEVLLLSDPVDDFWLSAVTEFDGKPLKSITRGTSDLADIAGPDEANHKTPADRPREAELATLTALLKQVLGRDVADVRVSDRLTDTAVCLVADETGPDLNLERILKHHNQLAQGLPKVLEINPDHALIKAMVRRAAAAGGADALADHAHLLLDQARVLEGEPLPDPAAFSRRLAAALAAAIES